MPPPRNRFQLHLSTAMVMMFVTGGLMWANSYKRIVYLRAFHQVYSHDTPYYSGVRGFPYIMYKDVYGYGQSNELEAPHFIWKAVLLNVAIAIAILVSVSIAFEWLIRRRAARKGE